MGIQKAFEEKVVRLQNPALLLEQGMQTGNRYLGTLLCVMGLDMLFMAGSKMPFISRLGGFLGLDSYVFPPVLSLDIQPREVVADVIEDVYELRNLIAHGLEIPEKPYRQYCDLRSTTGERINYVNYHYGDLILDSSLFLLTRALRKIFIENLYEDVKDVARWRAKMTLYEHRYKNAGGFRREPVVPIVFRVDGTPFPAYGSSLTRKADLFKAESGNPIQDKRSKRRSRTPASAASCFLEDQCKLSNRNSAKIGAAVVKSIFGSRAAMLS